MKKLRNYIEFIKENNQDNNDSNIFEEIAPFSIDNRPKNDTDIKREKNFIIDSVKKFDDIFGTNYYEKFGSDFHVLVGKEVYFSKEIIESLSEEAIKPGVYVRFDLLKNKDENIETLYDHLMKLTLMNQEGKEDNETLDFLCSQITSKVNKEEVYYRLFRKIGSEFNQEVIKDTLEVKTSYDLGGNNKPMDKNMQRSFLISLKNSLKHYQNKVQKGKFNIIDSKELFGKVIEYYLKSDLINNLTIREDYIKKRLNDWYEYMRII